MMSNFRNTDLLRPPDMYKTAHESMMVDAGVDKALTFTLIRPDTGTESDMETSLPQSPLMRKLQDSKVYNNSGGSSDTNY